MTTYTATARRWEHGWELHVDGVGVTQCTTLDQAKSQIADYVCTVRDLDAIDGDIVVTPDIAGVADIIAKMRRDSEHIDSLARGLADDRMAVIATMKADGFSYADIAGAVGVSKGRVAQLIKG